MRLSRRFCASAVEVSGRSFGTEGCEQLRLQLAWLDFDSDEVAGPVRPDQMSIAAHSGQPAKQDVGQAGRRVIGNEGRPRSRSWGS